MDIVDPRIDTYLHDLLAGDHPVADEMERLAEERRFPIVDRPVGVTLELLARAIGARRVLELGSGFGYSAYWFARAVGDGGEVHMTERDPDNLAQARAFLEQDGLAGRVREHAGDALELIDELDGAFDVIFCDIDKLQYPRAWEKARERIRPGGLYLCDNVLWSGYVVPDPGEKDPRPDWTAAVREHNAAIAGDDRYATTIIPTRDGVLAALRLA